MKKTAAIVLTAIMTALICTSCIFSDPLIVSHKYADMFAGTWLDDSNNVIRVGRDDDTIGSIDYTKTPDDRFSYKSIGNWTMEKTTLSISWDVSAMNNQEIQENDKYVKITYTYANGLNDDIIEQGKDAIQKVYDKKHEEHQWYASDKYLCLDDQVFTNYKDR